MQTERSGASDQWCGVRADAILNKNHNTIVPDDDLIVYTPGRTFRLLRPRFSGYVTGRGMQLNPRPESRFSEQNRLRRSNQTSGSISRSSTRPNSVLATPTQSSRHLGDRLPKKELTERTAKVSRARSRQADHPSASAGGLRKETASSVNTGRKPDITVNSGEKEDLQRPSRTVAKPFTSGQGMLAALRRKIPQTKKKASNDSDSLEFLNITSLLSDYIGKNSSYKDPTAHAQVQKLMTSDMELCMYKPPKAKKKKHKHKKQDSTESEESQSAVSAPNKGKHKRKKKHRPNVHKETQELLQRKQSRHAKGGSVAGSSLQSLQSNPVTPRAGGLRRSRGKKRIRLGRKDRPFRTQSKSSRHSSRRRSSSRKSKRWETAFHGWQTPERPTDDNTGVLSSVLEVGDSARDKCDGSRQTSKKNRKTARRKKKRFRKLSAMDGNAVMLNEMKMILTEKLSQVNCALNKNSNVPDPTKSPGTPKDIKLSPTEKASKDKKLVRFSTSLGQGGSKPARAPIKTHQVNAKVSTRTSSGSGGAKPKPQSTKPIKSTSSNHVKQSSVSRSKGNASPSKVIPPVCPKPQRKDPLEPSGAVDKQNPARCSCFGAKENGIDNSFGGFHSRTLTKASSDHDKASKAEKAANMTLSESCLDSSTSVDGPLGQAKIQAFLATSISDLDMGQQSSSSVDPYRKPPRVSLKEQLLREISRPKSSEQLLATEDSSEETMAAHIAKVQQLAYAKWAQTRSRAKFGSDVMEIVKYAPAKGATATSDGAKKANQSNRAPEAGLRGGKTPIARAAGRRSVKSFVSSNKGCTSKVTYDYNGHRVKS